MISKTLRIRAIGEEQLHVARNVSPIKAADDPVPQGFFSVKFLGKSPTTNHHHPCKHFRSGEQAGRFRPVSRRGTSIGPTALVTPADEALDTDLPKNGMLFANSHTADARRWRVTSTGLPIMDPHSRESNICWLRQEKVLRGGITGSGTPPACSTLRVVRPTPGDFLGGGGGECAGGFGHLLGRR